MATVYPAKIDNSITLATIIDNTTLIDATSVNRIRDAIIAIETELGINPKSIYVNVRTRLDQITDAINTFGGITISGDLGGTTSDIKVIGFQGIPISGTMPVSGDFLNFDGYTWVPTLLNSQEPLNSVQFNKDNKFGGALNAFISSDGFLELTNNSSSIPSSTGDLRLSQFAKINVKSIRNTLVDYSFLNQFGYGGTKEGFISGRTSDSTSEIHSWTFHVKEAIESKVGAFDSGTNSYAAGFNIYTTGALPTITSGTYRFSAAYPNFLLSQSAYQLNLTSDPFGGGLGYFFIQDLSTSSSVNPNGGFYLWSDPSSHHPFIKLPNGISHDLISSNAASGNNNSIQYNSSGLFGGANHASISSDGYLQISNDRIGGSALTGDIRLSTESFIKARNSKNTIDLDVLCIDWYNSPFTGNRIEQLDIGLGSDSFSGTQNIFDSVLIDGYQFASLSAIGNQDNGSTASIGVIAPNNYYTGTGASISTAYAYPNFGLLTRDGVNNNNDLFNGGRGYVYLTDRTLTATGSPSNGLWMWSGPISHHPFVQLPNGNIYDLTDGYPGGSLNSVQYNNGFKLGGAGHVSIASDGYLQISNDKPGGAALIGDLRFPFESSSFIRDSKGLSDLLLFGTSSDNSSIPDGYQDNILLFGGVGASNRFDSIEFYPRKNQQTLIYHDGGGNAITGLTINAGDQLGNGQLINGVISFPNFAFGSTGSLNNDGYLNSTDPWNSGLGVILVKDINTLPLSNPSSGFYLWSNSTNHHPIVQLPSGLIIDLISDGYFTAGGDLTGTSSNQTVSKLQSLPLNTGSPVDGYVLAYDSGSGSIKFKNISGGGTGISAADHEALRQLTHFINGGGPAEGFVSGAYREILPAGAFPTSVTWWISSAKTSKIVEKLTTYNSNQNPLTITWHVYASDGVTILATAIDTIAYSGVFESSRTRMIS